MLSRYSSGRHKLSHHALEFLLDLITDVVGFAWINFAEEMLAQACIYLRFRASHASTYDLKHASAAAAAAVIGAAPMVLAVLLLCFTDIISPVLSPPPPPAQVFEVRAKTTLMYAVLAFAASLGAMEAGSVARGLLDWPVDFEETANQFDAGSFALPTRFVVLECVS